MKKFLALLLVPVFCVAVGSSVTAMQTQNVTVQKAVNQNSAEDINTKSATYEKMAVDKVNQLTERYLSNFRNCEPLHVDEYIDIFGLKFSFKIDINGWTDNKCGYKLSANVGGLGKDLREVFEVKVSDEAIAKIQPVVECNFTKEQLNILVDAIIARQEQNMTQISQMLENPEKKYDVSKKKLTKEEEALIKMLSEGKACTVPNMQELMEQFTQIMMPESGNE